METGRHSCTVFRTEAGPGSDDRPQFDGIALVTVTPRVISPRVLSGRSTGTTNVFFMNPPFRESDSRKLSPGCGSSKLLDGEDGEDAKDAKDAKDGEGAEGGRRENLGVARGASQSSHQQVDQSGGRIPHVSQVGPFLRVEIAEIPGSSQEV